MDPRKWRRLINGKRTAGSALRFLQSGQSMVLVALLMMVFIALLAVVFDGGHAYLQRRNAQTAADAGGESSGKVSQMGTPGPEMLERIREYRRRYGAQRSTAGIDP